MTNFFLLLFLLLFFPLIGFSQQIDIKNYKQKVKTIDKQILFLDSLKNKTKQKDILFDIYYQLGRIYYKQKPKYQLAKQNLKKALSVANDLSDKKRIYNTLRNIGFASKQFNEPDSALYYYNKALRVFEKDGYYQSKVYSNFAKLYHDENNIEEAFLYYYKSIVLGEKANRDLCTTYNNLGNLFLETNLDSAVHYYNKSLNQAVKNNKKRHQLRANINISIAYLNDFIRVKEAYKSLIKSRDLAIKIKDEQLLNFTHFYLAQYYDETKNDKKALFYFNKVLAEPSIKQHKELYIELLDQMSHFYQKRNNYKKALFYRNKHQKSKDSLFTLEKRESFEELRITYKVAEKDNQIVLLSKEKEITDNKRKTTLIIAISIVSLLILLTLFLRNKIKLQKEKQRSEHQLHIQQIKTNKAKNLIKGQEREQKRLAKELHDGLGGQLTGIKSLVQSISSTNILSKKKIIDKHLVSSVKNLRNISHDLSAYFLKDNLFSVLLQKLVQQSFETISIEVELSIFPKKRINDLSERYKLNIYRIIQEGLQNITKHAGASYVSVSLLLDKEISLLIEDNGVGFDKKAVKNGIGLQNIINRLQSLNGILQIDSEANKGTTLNIKIPLYD